MVERRTIPLVRAPGCDYARARGSESTYVRTLQLACLVVGGLEPLASHLGVDPAQLKAWLESIHEPPERVFLAAVELLLLHAEKDLRAS